MYHKDEQVSTDHMVCMDFPSDAEGYWLSKWRSCHQHECKGTQNHRHWIPELQ